MDVYVQVFSNEVYGMNDDDDNDDYDDDDDDDNDDDSFFKSNINMQPWWQV